MNLLKLSLKTTVLTLCYFSFAIFSIPAYQNIKVYANEKFLSNKKHLIINGEALVIEVANTEEKRIRGLSGRESLPEGTGMLFVFEKSQRHSIWMKDMQFSIDIIWMNGSGEIVHIVESAHPDSYPETFSPSQNSMYILEVPAGFIKKEELEVGNKIDLY